MSFQGRSVWLFGDTPLDVEAVDGARMDVVVVGQGELPDVGRSTRSIPAAIGCALWLRDGGCRMPGCGRNRHLHGHHIRGWAEGGTTKRGISCWCAPATTGC